MEVFGDGNRTPTPTMKIPFCGGHPKAPTESRRIPRLEKMPINTPNLFTNKKYVKMASRKRTGIIGIIFESEKDNGCGSRCL